MAGNKKKKMKAKVKKISHPEPVQSNHKSVNIRKASNGYVVSSYDNGKDTVMIAKTKKEAKLQAVKMMGL